MVSQSQHWNHINKKEQDEKKKVFVNKNHFINTKRKTHKELNTSFGRFFVGFESRVFELSVSGEPNEQTKLTER